MIHTRLRSQRCTHFFSTIHTHTVSLTLSNHLLPPPAMYPNIYPPIPTHSPSCNPVPLFPTQMPRIVCATKVSVSLSYRHHTVYSLTHSCPPLPNTPQVPHTEYHTNSHYPSPPPLSISNLHKRHFSFY